MIRQRLKDFCYYLSVYANPYYREWFRHHRAGLAGFRDRHAGESCFIVGNGPSLNAMDLDRLRGRTVFGLNKIFLIFNRFAEFRPSYHVAVNPLVIEQSEEGIRSLDCPSFLDYQAGYPRFAGCRHVNYLYTGGNLGFNPEITTMIPQGFTVTYVALQLAFFMGFKTVYLIGVDHNFRTEGDPNQKQRLSGDDENHFDPAYFRDMDWQLPDLEGSELAFRLADFHYRRAGRQVLDATVNGKLTIFPKISFDDALLQCKG